MVFRSTSLRMLLSLALILNGSAFAMPAMHGGMGIVSGVHADSMADEPTSARPPCHEPAMADDAAQAQSTDSRSHEDPAESPVPDCCKHGKCACTCIHALAAIPVIAVDLVAVFHCPVSVVGERGYPSPVLPQLSRPPIA
jgi:hypothetical protein